MLRFYVNDRLIQENRVSPTMTLLNYLRKNLQLTGTKEGCAEGDCGACTVAIAERKANGEAAYRAVNSCLLLLPSLQGKRIYTVEALKRQGEHHLVQQEMAVKLGSQCGYCTPGIVMSMFAGCYRDDVQQEWQVDDQLCGNLCRCTGYRPIRDAAQEVIGRCPADYFAKQLAKTSSDKQPLHYTQDDRHFIMPDTWSALWDAIDQHANYQLVCGATDLGLSITKKYVEYPCLISVEALAELTSLEKNNGQWVIGAAVPLAEIELAVQTTLPSFSRMLRYFGARQIKNRATIGGNICTASPIGDTPPVLLALNATVIAASRHGKRKIPIHEFFTAYRKTALQRGEIVHSIEIPIPAPKAKVGSYKVSKRRELDISAVAASMYVELDAARCVATVRLAYGGMAATPGRATKTEAFLVGKPWTEEVVRQAMKLIQQDFQPMNDQRGSAWYRWRTAQNLLLGFFVETENRQFVDLKPRHCATVIVEAQS